MFEIETLQQLLVPAVILVPIVTGLVEVVKRAIGINERYLPIVSVVLGAILGLLAIQLTALGAVVGVIIGLGAVGLFEFGRTTVFDN